MKLEIDDLITTAEAAQILGLVPDTVRKMAQRGRLAVAAELRAGWRLYRRRDIEKLKAARERNPDPKTGRPRGR